MKTSFSRTFYPAVATLLLALFFVGISFQNLVRDQINDRSLSLLKDDAAAVARLAGAYEYSESFTPEEFYISLAAISNASNSDTVLCNTRGVLTVCSEAPMGCKHQGLTVSPDFLQQVLTTGSVVDICRIDGLYNDLRFMAAVPITDEQGNAIGIVISSTPASDTVSLFNALSRSYLTVSVIIFLLCVLCMIMVAQRHSRPLSNMRKAAVAFGHGDLTARVQVNPTDPVEVQEFSLAFNNMADFLQKSEYQRQEFVANVSHELKTPMTTISGFADGILDGTIPPEKQAQYLRLISEETKRLSRLVRSMLDISRLQDSGGIPDEQKTRFDVEECAGQVLLPFEQQITAKNIEVSVDMPDYPVFTRAHQDYITQVIYNLLDNAVKFSDGELKLSIRTGGNKIYVTVSNSGKTIPAKELPLVFDRFHKIDKSRTENRDGWGLGLYIVKTIVCAHGEDISVQSANGTTSFIFTLPLIN